MNSHILEKKIGKVIWITGLSGSGKSTLATALVEKLRTTDIKPILLDGDELRVVFDRANTQSIEYGRDDRILIAKQYSKLCQMLSSQGFTVVIATISMFKEIHAWNRSNIVNYHEVYLKVPIYELISRDPKGLYRRYQNGEISNLAGLDLEVDEPNNPDIIFNSENKCSIEFMTQKLITSLFKEIK